MEEEFLLRTKTARRLYHDGAERLPIIDPHNHLSMKDLMENRQFENLAQLWVVSDPYKHRVMRICGVPEARITGPAGDYEKYLAWMETLPKLIGNALYDWSILEMKRVFELDLVPGVTNPAWLWDTVNQKLRQPDYAAQALLRRFHVAYAAPCASAVEDVSAYGFTETLAPSLRGDDLVAPTGEVFKALEKETGIIMDALPSFQRAIQQRLDAFHAVGCRFSDHALDNGFSYWPDDGKNEGRFLKLIQGARLQGADAMAFASGMLRFLAAEYAARGWTMQLHIGAQRYTSTRLRNAAGPAGGFAGIGSGVDVQALTRMLDDFEQSAYGMPRIILFTLNPSDNAVMSVLSGSYTQDGVEGKVQQGPAWWWCDHLHGMREVFDSIAAYGVLWTFFGMTTDSRSLLSFVRHEYFRRAFCGWLGDKVEQGEILAPEAQLMELVKRVCWSNAKNIIAGGSIHAF